MISEREGLPERIFNEVVFTVMTLFGIAAWIVAPLAAIYFLVRFVKWAWYF